MMAYGFVGSKVFVHSDTSAKVRNKLKKVGWVTGDIVSPQHSTGVGVCLASTLGSLHRSHMQQQLNCIHSILTVRKPDSGCDPLRRSSSINDARAVPEHYFERQRPIESTRVQLSASVSDGPWVLSDGSINTALLNRLRHRVAAILSTKPGANLPTLASEILMLSKAHLGALLELMQREGLVEARLPPVGLECSGPFDPPATVPDPASRPLEEVSYFLTVKMEL